MSGEPWKSTSAVIATTRAKKIPTLLDGIDGPAAS
jgi:hypothetical protein